MKTSPRRRPTTIKPLPGYQVHVLGAYHSLAIYLVNLWYYGGYGRRRDNALGECVESEIVYNRL